MRITPHAREAIVRTTAELAGAGARVHLFGSRLHDHLRGGDIDLLVQCPQPVARPVWLVAQITARLQRALGERKIDVLLIDPSTVIEPVHRVAQAEGVELTMDQGGWPCRAARSTAPAESAAQHGATRGSATRPRRETAGRDMGLMLIGDISFSRTFHFSVRTI